MASSNRKQILAIGLKSGADPDPNREFWSSERLLKAIAQQFELAKQAGFDADNFQIDLAKPHDASLDELRAVLREKHWDGVSVGFGLRGRQDLTPLFEQIMNTIVEEVQPTPKLAFSLRPDSVWEAFARVYGVKYEAQANA